MIEQLYHIVMAWLIANELLVLVFIERARHD
jgi:hypothetical protein